MRRSGRTGRSGRTRWSDNTSWWGGRGRRGRGDRGRRGGETGEAVGEVVVGAVGRSSTPINLPQEDPPDLIPEAAGGSLAQRMARARAYALGEPMPE